MELDIGAATLSSGLDKTTSRGVASAVLPAPLGQGGPRPKATWQFSVPHAGVYYVWVRYTTLDAKRVSQFWIDCDGDKQLQGADWRLRFPCTLTRHLDGVKPGPHTLSVAFEPAHAPNGPRLSAVYLSNDPSYRAPGFDPRVDFRK